MITRQFGITISPHPPVGPDVAQRIDYEMTVDGKLHTRDTAVLCLAHGDQLAFKCKLDVFNDFQAGPRPDGLLRRMWRSLW